MNHSIHRPVFVVFEGLDGAGKTSVAQHVASTLGAEYMTTPSEQLRKHRNEIVSSYDSQEAVQTFYLSTVLDASHKAGALLEKGRSVVLDRYFLSTEAYAAFRGSKLRNDELCRFLTPADLTVFLFATLPVRRSRLIGRGATVADVETLTEAAQHRLLSEHELRADLPVVGRFMAVDTSSLSVGEATSRVLAEIGGLAFSTRGAT
jgi:dTMP kinase